MDYLNLTENAFNKNYFYLYAYAAVTDIKSLGEGFRVGLTA